MENLENKIEVRKRIISHQLNSNNEPIFDFQKGDILRKKKDGIYLTRKIDFGSNTNMYATSFESLKIENAN